MTPVILMEEIASLQEAGYQIQHSLVGNRVYVIFKDYELPEKIFNQDSTDLIVWTSTSYPLAAFDMFWTDDTLLLKNGSIPHGANVFETHIDKRWRRFSIHPYNHKRWNPSEDNLAGYLVYINQRLKSGR